MINRNLGPFGLARLNLQLTALSAIMVISLFKEKKMEHTLLPSFVIIPKNSGMFWLAVGNTSIYWKEKSLNSEINNGF